MRVCVIWGPPCSGKSTYARTNMGEADVVYDYDRLIQALTLKETHTTQKSCAHEIAVQFRVTFISKLSDDSSISTAYILTRFPSDALKRRLSSFDTEYVRMDTTLEECLERLSGDDSRPDKDEWESIIREWFEKYGDSEDMRMGANDRAARQVRCLAQKFETREENGNLFIEGYFSVFNSPYELWEGASEVVKPGAFTDCVGQDVRALINHDSTLVLGRTKAGTLELKEDSRGLWGRIKINRDDVDAMNLYARVQRGDVDQCSFGFDIERETFVDLGGGAYRWEIEKVNPLYEVSVCTFPAYEETSVSARKKQLEDIQQRKADAWRETMKKKLGGN